MRAALGLISLLLALLVIAWLAKTELRQQTTVQLTPGSAPQTASQALGQLQQSLNKALNARPASVPE